MTIESGKLRHRIIIEEPVYAQDQATGGMTPTWQQFALAWAAIEPLSARDLVAAKAQQSKVIARIVCRAVAGIAPNMRISHNGRIYSIEGILPDKESGLEYITIPVSEGIKEV